ncbi:MAG: DUF4365 domain-containing protein [Candidatus Ranarchaeia archaeon]
MPEFPKRHESKEIDRIGVGIVNSMFSKLGWEFLERPMQHDYGIDGDADIFENNDATGKTFRVQIKTGTSYTGKLIEGQEQKISITKKVANYWCASAAQAFLLAVHHISETVYCVLATEQARQKKDIDNDYISIVVPQKNILDRAAISQIKNLYDQYIRTHYRKARDPGAREVRELPIFKEILEFKEIAEKDIFSSHRLSLTVREGKM